MRYLIFICAILFSCSEPKPPTVQTVVIEELKVLDRGHDFTPDLFLITKNRQSIDMFHNKADFVRLRKGDSIRITERYGYIEKIELLNENK